MAERIDSGSVSLLGGRLCLDFANTVEWHAGGEPIDLLKDYRDLLVWAERAQLLNRSDAAVLLERSREEPAATEAVLRDAVELREALYRLLVSVVKGSEPNSADLEIFNRSLARMLSEARIRSDRGRFSLDLTGSRESLDWFIRPVVWSAVEMLRSGELNRLKQCDDESCGWLFWDTSRNRSRRWCSMEDCGNRAKARRFYGKKKKSP